MKEPKKLTTNAVAPVVDNQNVMTAGPRGPMLLQDVWFLEKLAQFDREVIRSVECTPRVPALTAYLLNFPLTKRA